MMAVRCLSVDECKASLGSIPILFGDRGQAYLATACDRVEAHPTGNISILANGVDYICRWLPPATSRLFCLNDWGFGALGQPDSLLVAARNGIGEPRSLADAPVHYFPRLSWTWDALEQTEEEKAEIGFLSGLIISTICCSWSAWLVAEDCHDAIEIWEGNVLFYSPDAARLQAARELIEELGYPSKMK